MWDGDERTRTGGAVGERREDARRGGGGFFLPFIVPGEEEEEEEEETGGYRPPEWALAVGWEVGWDSCGGAELCWSGNGGPFGSLLEGTCEGCDGGGDKEGGGRRPVVGGGRMPFGGRARPCLVDICGVDVIVSVDAICPEVCGRPKVDGPGAV